MSTLKGDIINGALSRIRISGLTVSPSGPDYNRALERLDEMIASWQNWNIVLPYNHEESPDTGTPHGLPIEDLPAVKTHLALWLLTDYGKPVPESLAAEARAHFSMLMAKYATVKKVPYPARMPIGSGNTHYRGQYDQFFGGGTNASVDYDSTQLYTEDVKDLEESFSTNLRSDNSETVASFSISSDDSLTIVTSSLSSPVVSFRVQAGATEAERQKVTIKVTTSLGQIITRVLYFDILEA